ncbi:MAG: ATPase, T2SS/T4P/T4SS family, partial [Oscillospiraceae bacterium]
MDKILDIKNILEEVVGIGASDIFVVAGSPIIYKLKGRMIRYNDDVLKPQDTKEIISQIYDMSNRNFGVVEEKGEDDFSFSIKGAARFRANSYKQRGSVACSIRIVPFNIPDYKKLLIPEEVMSFAGEKNGLVLVTGASGSGKSTTLSCIIDKINHSRECHIITIEDPIETLHAHEKSIVSQREVMTDTKSYLNALKSSLRQSPDVILLGELRDYETIDIAMTAAETGHLIFSSLHTVGASNTIDRI